MSFQLDMIAEVIHSPELSLCDMQSTQIVILKPFSLKTWELELLVFIILKMRTEKLKNIY